MELIAFIVLLWAMCQEWFWYGLGLLILLAVGGAIVLAILMGIAVTFS